VKKLSLLFLFAFAALLVAEETIRQLPEFEPKGGMPLMEALAKRSSCREYLPGKKLDDATLAKLLWAVNGFNRKDKRTAPSAINMQEIDVYVVDSEGAWLYDAQNNALKLVQKGNFMADTGMQPFVAQASLNLVFVADAGRVKDEKICDKFGAVDAAFCAQNCYLFCASEGLGTVVRGSFQEKKLASDLKLMKKQSVVLCMTIGYPAEK